MKIGQVCWRRMVMLAAVVAAGTATTSAQQVFAQSSQPAAEVPVTKPTSVPDGEKAEKVNSAVTRIKGVLQLVLDLREEARDSKDVVKLNYVNDKLTQVTGLLRLAEQAEVGLKDALARRDHEAAEHEFTKVSFILEKTEAMRGEAESSVGALVVYSGATTVTVETKKKRKGDPTQSPLPVLPVDRAVPASPYQ